MFEGITLSLLVNNDPFRASVAEWVLDLDGENALALVDAAIPMLTGAAPIKTIMPNESGASSAFDLTLGRTAPGGGFEKLTCPVSGLPAEVQVKATRSVSGIVFGLLRRPLLDVYDIQISDTSTQYSKRYHENHQLNGKYKYVITSLSDEKGEPVWKLAHQQVSRMVTQGRILCSLSGPLKDRIRGPEHFAIDQQSADEVARQCEELLSNPGATSRRFVKPSFTK